MQVTLPYGQEAISFQVPDQAFLGLLDPPNVEVSTDPEGMIRHAIRNPIGTGTLDSFITKDKKIAVIVDDGSRPTPISTILPVLLSELDAIGVPKENILIIAALGSHRYMTEAELRDRVGSEVYQNYRVINSEFRDPSRLVYVGKAPDGVDIYATKEVMEADVRIAVGNIVPHPVMGWSGGGKMLYPGVAGEKTVAYFHLKGSLIDENMFGTEQYPIRNMMEQWVDTIGLDFIVNTVLTATGGLYRVVAGHYIHAHRAGVQHAKAAQGCKVPERSHVIVVSGHPADQDFWQSPKGMYAAEPALCGERGTIILVSPNYEGLGPHKELPEYMMRTDGDDLVTRAIRGEDIGADPLAVAVGNNMSKLRRRHQLVVVSDGVTAEEMAACGCKHYPKAAIQQAINEAMAQYPDCKISAMSNGAESFLYR